MDRTSIENGDWSEGLQLKEIDLFLQGAIRAMNCLSNALNLTGDEFDVHEWTTSDLTHIINGHLMSLERQRMTLER